MYDNTIPEEFPIEGDVLESLDTNNDGNVDRDIVDQNGDGAADAMIDYAEDGTEQITINFDLDDDGDVDGIFTKPEAGDGQWKYAEVADGEVIPGSDVPHAPIANTHLAEGPLGLTSMVNLNSDGDGVTQVELKNGSLADGYDTNADGIIDKLYIDVDGNGAFDVLVADFDHDQGFDHIATDADEDGAFDGWLPA
ncbi:hypothetical protein JRG19_01900 [Pseudoclavibacter alba]|uniref:hypothetical protein n=1 Tax=Pseudoclavibacter albus TaxID=272241 RepID=UPI0019D09B48|nr:hypothetical protein [Pseudoclavibacter alba]MBN6777306.1 hypothetical protein [Pseudoclavibacter alba]